MEQEHKSGDSAPQLSTDGVSGTRTGGDTHHPLTLLQVAWVTWDRQTPVTKGPVEGGSRIPRQRKFG